MLLAACKEDTKAPSWVIPENKMVEILIQIHLAESRVSLKNLPADSSNKYFQYLQGNIYSNYKVDSVSFNKSFKYYSADSKKIDQIYSAVVDSLSLRETMKKLY